VLAVDQTIKQDKGQQVVLAKTATLELTPAQARAVVRAQAAGPLSLALRPLSDGATAVASVQHPVPATATPAPANDDDSVGDGVRIIRYGAESGVNGKKD
jgi:pilus assembly protein CpaB